jgi:hypothetical protein
MRFLASPAKWTLTLFLLAAAARAADANSHPALDSHFENDQVILNQPHPGIEIPESLMPLEVLNYRRRIKGAHGWHNHRLNRVMVYIHTGGELLHYLNGYTEELKWQPGTVTWSEASGYHYSEPPAWTVPPFTGPMIVDIGIKKPGYPGKLAVTPLDPLRVDPKDFKLLFENSQVRVLRLKLGPYQSVPMHEYGLNRLLVHIADQSVHVTSSAGKTEVATYKAGDTSWGVPSKEKIENPSDTTIEMVIVELKSIY